MTDRNEINIASIAADVQTIKHQLRNGVKAKPSVLRLAIGVWFGMVLYSLTTTLLIVLLLMFGFLSSLYAFSRSPAQQAAPRSSPWSAPPSNGATP